MTTLTTTRAADVLAALDAGTATTRFVSATEATDPHAVFLTDEGLELVFAPDRRFPGEPYAHAVDGWPRYARHELGRLRVVEAGEEGGIG